MNESKGSKTEYVWDYRNRLASVSEKNSSNVVLERTDYFYDGFNRLIRRTHDADGAGGGVAVDNFYIQKGSQIALQFDGASASDLTNRYLWGPAVDQILADEQVTSLGSAGSLLWPLADNQGTIRDVVNSSGVVQNHLEYDSFGAVTAESNTAVDHLYGYTGRERDEESGLNFHRARYTDPNVGHFLSLDPMTFSAGDANLGRYVHNSPVNLADPNGLKEKPPSTTAPVAPSTISSAPLSVGDEVTVTSPLGQDFTGTVCIPAGSPVDLPANSLVIGTNSGVPHANAAIDMYEPDPLYVYGNVPNWTELYYILLSHYVEFGPASVPILMLRGHGRNGGPGCLGGFSCDAERLMQHPRFFEIAELVQELLPPDGCVVVGSCTQWDEDDAPWIQFLSIVFDAPVISNTLDVEYPQRDDGTPLPWRGNGPWIIVGPQDNRPTSLP